MKQIEPKIRSEFRKSVIMACHPGCETLNEALRAEIKLPFDSTKCCIGDDFVIFGMPIKAFKGLPITLGRVLSAIKAPYTCYKNIDRTNTIKIVCNDIRATWRLLNEGGEESSDDDQPVETIKLLLDMIKNETN